MTDALTPRSVDGHGEYDRIIAKRAAVVDRLSPAAKHAHFPTIYAKPMPVMSEAQKLRNELHRVQGALDEARAENSRLQATLKKLQAMCEGRGGAVERVERGPRVFSPAAVQNRFLEEYNALSAVDGRELMALADLIGPRRGFASSHPRQVCMWLCAKLCKGCSLPVIGRAFGGKDHTTVMHAKRVAPDRMQTRPDLHLVALRVIAHFEATP